MKTLRFALPLLALAGLLSAGCVLTSAQVLATYDLPNPMTLANGSTFEHVDVDLNTVKEYADHKDQLKDVVDLAILGRFENQAGSPALSVSVYITPDYTAYGDPSELIMPGSAAIPIWGPLGLPTGPSTTQVKWDDSARLFGAGKSALLREIKGDGRFSLYVVASASPFDVRIRNGAVAIVLSGGI